MTAKIVPLLSLASNPQAVSGGIALDQLKFKQTEEASIAQ
jgi:hypothetical protein